MHTETIPNNCNLIEIEVSHLERGLYFVEYTQGSNIIVKKVIKNEF